MIYQITAPLLDACVLGIVAIEDTYGYTLTQKVRELVDISESTLYPVLRRLQKDGQLTTYDRPFQGRNRRYYSITDSGRTQLKFYSDEWEVYKEKIDRLIGYSGSGSELRVQEYKEKTDTDSLSGKSDDDESIV